MALGGVFRYSTTVGWMSRACNKASVSRDFEQRGLCQIVTFCIRGLPGWKFAWEGHTYRAGPMLDGPPWALIASSTLISPLIQGLRRSMKVRILSLAAMTAALVLAACAGAPVQEMSDARQAVAVAEQTLAGKP